MEGEVRSDASYLMSEFFLSFNCPLVQLLKIDKQGELNFD